MSAELSAAKELGSQRNCLQPKSLVVGGVVSSQRAWLSAELSAAKQLGCQWSCLQPKSLAVSGVVCSHRAWSSSELQLVTHVVALRGGGDNALGCVPLSGLLGQRSRLVMVPI